MSNVDPSAGSGRSHLPFKRVSRKENRGGYDCEFVEKPSDAVQGGECPVCLLVLKEPFLTELLWDTSFVVCV